MSPTSYQTAPPRESMIDNFTLGVKPNFAAKASNP